MIKRDRVTEANRQRHVERKTQTEREREAEIKIQRPS